MKTNIRPKLHKQIKSKVYEYYYTFGDFVDMFINKLEDNVSENEQLSINDTYTINHCFSHLFVKIPKLKKLFVSRGLCSHTSKQYEYTKKIYNLIPKDIWDTFYDQIYDWLSNVDNPYEDMAVDAFDTFIHDTTMKDIDKSMCNDCAQRIHCELKGGNKDVY